MKKALALLAVLAMALPATAQTLPQDTYGKPSSGAPIGSPTGGSTAPTSPAAPSQGSGTTAPVSPSDPSSPSGTSSSSPSGTTSSPSGTTSSSPSGTTSSPSGTTSATDKPAGSSDSAGSMMKDEKMMKGEKTQTTGEKPAEEKPSGKQYKLRNAPAAAPASPSS